MTASSIFTVSRPTKWTSLLLDFPEVTRESPIPTKFLHDVVHELHTTGPAIFVWPRHLPHIDSESHDKNSTSCYRKASADRHRVPGPARYCSTARRQKRWFVSTLRRLPTSQRGYESWSIPVIAPTRFHREFGGKNYLYEIGPRTSILSGTHRTESYPQDRSYDTVRTFRVPGNVFRVTQRRSNVSTSN
jgi:hypothetical protein